MKLRDWSWIAVACCCGFACTTKEPEVAEPAPENTPAAKAEETKPAPPSTSSPDCVGAVAAGEAKTVTIGKQTWELSGS
ncbi:MAG: hypothetical protein AAFY60_00920, partial [Myxococcota bacterium]